MTRALTSTPRMLLLDEPSLSLSLVLVVNGRVDYSEIHNEGMIVLLVDAAPRGHRTVRLVLQTDVDVRRSTRLRIEIFRYIKNLDLEMPSGRRILESSIAFFVRALAFRG